MNSRTLTNAVPHEFGRTLAALPDAHISPELPASRVMRRYIQLDRGDMLRILDGRGTQLTSASGVLWITEEGSADDNVLLPGTSHRIENAGMALVSAHRNARVVLGVSRRSIAAAPRRTCLNG